MAPGSISFAVQPTLSALAIDPYRVPRNVGVTNNPAASDVYRYYGGPVTYNYITHVYPPGTVQAPQTAADKSKDTASLENPATRKGGDNSRDHDKLAADHAALVLRLAKTEKDLEEMRAQLVASVSHLLLACLALTVAGALNKTLKKASSHRSRSPVPVTPADAWGGTGSKAGSRAASPARSNQGGGWGGNSNAGSAPASNDNDKKKDKDQGWGTGGDNQGGAEGGDGWGGDAAAPDAAGGGGGW